MVLRPTLRSTWGQSAPTRLRSAAPSVGDSSSPAHTQGRIGRWHRTSPAEVAASGVASRGIPTQYPRISLLRHFSVPADEDGRRHAERHSAKTSKQATDSLDATRGLVNAWGAR